jgi:hypothetical protein
MAKPSHPAERDDSRSESTPQGLNPRIFLALLTARLEAVPFQNSHAFQIPETVQ